MIEPTYTADESLAAMCLWEEFACNRNADAAPWAEDLEAEGTCSIRDRILDMAKLCQFDWEEAHPELFDAPFDWEFVPAWLAHNYSAFRDGQRREPTNRQHQRERLAWLDQPLPDYWQLWAEQDGTERLSLNRLASRRVAEQHKRMMELNHRGPRYSIRPAIHEEATQ